MEVISLDEMTGKYHHHLSSFLPHYQLVEVDFESLVSSNIVVSPQSPILIQNVESEGSFSNITKNTLVDISMKHNNVELIHLGHNCSS